MKIALVLEGGGMRGVYTAGVLDLFMEKELMFTDIFGVSAGCCCGINYKSEQSGRSISLNVIFSHDSRYIGLKSLVKEGNYFGLDFIFDDVSRRYYKFDFKAYRENKMNLYAVSTNVETGKAEYFLIKDLEKIDMEYAKASCAIPIISSIREVEQYKLLDGGVADPIPYKKAFEMGFDKVVVVLTRNRGFRLKKRVATTKLMSVFYKQYPDFLEALGNRYDLYNQDLTELEELEKQKKAFVFYPSKPLKMDRLEKDKEKLFDLYNNGYEDAELLYDELLKFIASE